jgi:uncharacterized phage protein (TIGR01671 family)
MNFEKKVPEYVIKIFASRNIHNEHISYFAWPQTFGSTAGPHPGIGGQVVCNFTVEAYVANRIGPTVYICSDMYSFKEGRFEPFKNIKSWIPLSQFMEPTEKREDYSRSKFRAWDKRYHRMIGFEEICETMTCSIFRNEDYEVMRYGGLPDQEEKDIYEGDILEPIIINGSITSGIVFFEEGCFWVKQNISRCAQETELYLNVGKVIGNIYENPELLV